MNKNNGKEYIKLKGVGIIMVWVFIMGILCGAVYHKPVLRILQSIEKEDK